MNTILVTGGAGYIGSHCCKALAGQGYLPVSYDNLSRGFAEAVQWGPLEMGDLLDKERLIDVIRAYQPAAVLHFAALAYVGESVILPAAYWENNVGGSLCLLEAMKQEAVTKLVFSSSCAVYGEPSQSIVSESTPLNPVNPYGRSKQVVEQMLQDCGQAWGLNSVSLRYFNAAGADPDGELGENHIPETHLIPLVLQSILEPENPLTVFGTDFSTKDGSGVRDYIHVTDLANAHLLALQLLDNPDRSESHTRLNLGTEQGYSVFEIIAAAERVTGRKACIVQGSRRPGDPPALISDASEARRQLGWQPSHSSLEQMISDAWNYLNQRRNTH